VQPLPGDPCPGVVLVMHDTTELRRLESLRRDFIANVSHELRTPVTAIQGYAETLLDGETDAASTHEFVEAIHRHGARIGALVARLLQLSELEARAPDEVLSEPVDLHAISQLAVRAARAKHGDALPKVEIDIPEPTWVEADPLGVEQVIDNLLDNAIKYGASGGRVRIEAERDGDSVIIRVIDHGDGIPAEHLERVFERFYCVDKARSRDKGGSGLGLAITKHLCEAMGGSIEVQSRAGEGTRFTVTLPMATPA
jgi:two-component system phosphate regulon sensor histidine kinase PhoR